MSVGWVRWFPSDWRGSVRVSEMSPTERCAYFELLQLQALHGGSFEYDPARLARQVRMDRAEFERAWPVVSAMFEQDGGGRWFNAKMQAEVDRGEAYSTEAQREKGMKRAQSAPRVGGRFAPAGSPAGSPAAHQPDSPADRQPSPTPTPTPRETQTQSAEPEGAMRPARSRAPTLEAQIATRPVGISEDAWTRWVTHQWQRKRPTPSALTQHRERLSALAEARGGPAADGFIDQCIGANAQGIPRWAYDAAMSGQATVNGAGRRTEGVGERLARELREEGIELE